MANVGGAAPVHDTHDEAGRLFARPRSARIEAVAFDRRATDAARYGGRPASLIAEFLQIPFFEVAPGSASVPAILYYLGTSSFRSTFEAGKAASAAIPTFRNTESAFRPEGAAWPTSSCPSW